MASHEINYTPVLQPRPRSAANATNLASAPSSREQHSLPPVAAGVAEQNQDHSVTENLDMATQAGEIRSV
jgi:hypothetical protein